MFIKGDYESQHMMGIGHLATQMATRSNKTVEAVLDTVFNSLRNDQSGVLRNLVKTNLIEGQQLRRVGQLRPEEAKDYQATNFFNVIDQHIRKQLGVPDIMTRPILKSYDTGNLMGKTDTRFL
jgi:hypothetical protein